MSIEAKEPLILSVSGPDRPGILAALSRVLSNGGIEIIDIEQATLQDFLALSFLVDLSSDKSAASTIVQQFFPTARRLGLAVESRVVSREELRDLKSHDLWVLTLLGQDRIAPEVAVVSAVTEKHQANIVSIRRLAETGLRAAEFILDAGRVPNLDAFRHQLIQEAESVGVDVALARGSIYRQNRRIVVLDGDSTLIAGEVIDELAKVAGAAQVVSEITERAMQGELDFEASLRERVSHLRGLTVEQLEEVAERIPLTPGAEDMVKALHGLGLKVGVISGGFTFFTEHLRERLDLDYAIGNVLEIENGRLTGNVLPPIVDAEAKASHVREIAKNENVSLTQVVTVGDGANDIPMLQAAGLGVAFRAKEVTRKQADAAIHRNSLHGLLYLLGVSDSDLIELLGKSTTSR